MIGRYSYLWVVIIFLSLIWACQADMDRQTEKPISKKKMVDVLYDLHICDGLVLNVHKSPFKLDFNEKSAYKFVLDKHHITDSLLASSIVYYASFPKMFEEIYAEVIQRLSIKSEELKKIDEDRKKELLRLEEIRLKLVRDSLGRIFADSVRSAVILFKITADSLSVSLDSLLKNQDLVGTEINSLRSRADFLKINFDSLLQTVDSTYRLPVDTLIRVSTISETFD